jgi:hypothetical protein
VRAERDGSHLVKQVMLHTPWFGAARCAAVCELCCADWGDGVGGDGIIPAPPSVRAVIITGALVDSLNPAELRAAFVAVLSLSLLPPPPGDQLISPVQHARIMPDPLRV